MITESEVMSGERQAQLAVLRATLAAARERITSVTTSLGLQPRLGKISTMVTCPVNPEHRIKEENLLRHAAACRWQKRGYNTDDLPLPGERGDLGLVISNEDARHIIQDALIKNPMLKTGSCVQITTTRVDCRPAAVGGLVEGCEPETWQRITVDFTPDERRVIYDHVVAMTAPQRVPPPPELTFSGPRPVPRHGAMDDENGETLVAKMAAERDARRRRVSQKKVSTNRKSHLEILREVIGNQMQLYSEWLGDENADLTAGTNRDSRASSSEVQHARRPSETMDNQTNESVRYRDYSRHRDKERDERGREIFSGRVEDSRRGVRFKEDNGRQREWHRNQEGKEKERYRERDGNIEDYARHRGRGRDIGGNQKPRGSYEYSEFRDSHKERATSWESNDKCKERRDEKARHIERQGGESDKHRDRSARYKDRGKEYSRQRDDISSSSVRHRDQEVEFRRRDSRREDNRFQEDRNRNRGDDWERLDEGRTEEDDGYRDRYSRRDREERIEPRSGNDAAFAVKQEQGSDEEGPARESDYGTVVQVKTEKDGDCVTKRGKRKHEENYDWSEDSEKEAKKRNKKKKKKHKKHKKRKVQSSSEQDSS